MTLSIPRWVGTHRGRRLLRLGRFVFEPGIAVYLTLGIVMVIIVLMAATTVADVRSRRADIRSGMVQTGQDFAAIANGMLADGLLSNDLNEMAQFSSALWAQRDTSYVKIYDHDGRLLVGPAEDQFPKGVVDASVIRQVAGLQADLRWTDSGLEVTAPVTSGAQLIGAVQFGFDKMRIDDEIRELTNTRIWQTLSLIVLGGVGSVLISNYFVAPIRLLVATTEKVGTGDLSARVEKLRGREMSNLGDSFNGMTAEIQGLVSALEESRARIVSGQERVQREIAGHLHGPVQGRLLALRAQIDEVTRQEGMPEEAGTILRTIVDEMGEVIQSDIARLSRRLYPAIVRRGLVVALQSLADQFESSLDLELRFPAGLDLIERTNRNIVPERTRLAAYRIVNEALGNAVKHAPQSHVRVSVEGPTDGWLLIRIEDDGPGFDVRNVTMGLGLSVMQDYAQAIGGTSEIVSAPNSGTTIAARLPIETEVEPPGLDEDEPSA